MKIGIFGGTFNPPHIGHMQAAEAVRRELDLDLVLMVPVAAPPHKQLSGDTPKAADRFEMTRIAVSGMPHVTVSDIELRRGGVSYTWDTVCELKNEYPDGQFFLILGGDMFFTLMDWYEAEKLMKSVEIAVLVRESGDQRQKAEEFAARLSKDYGAKIHVLENEVIEISSTLLRRVIAEGRGGGYLKSEVYDYIEKKGLYRPNRYDFDAFWKYSKSVLSEKRLRHVMGCEEEAVKLARRWGADENDARAAAILHDITKELGEQHQLKLCEKYGIILDAAEKSTPKIIHAKTGAAEARARFNVPDAVYEAILCHTTAKADMSLLDKVLFMADYVEPSRDFEGLEQLRALAYEDLDKAVILGLVMSGDDLNERGMPVHKNSEQALKWLNEHPFERKENEQ